MWVPAPYKQTKNQTNATTDITAGSCYREVRWNWKVSTNGQNPTFSHLSARSQLRKWQWPSSSRCVAGHRQGHPEKAPHFSKELPHGYWKLNKNYSQQCQIFWVTECGCLRPTSKPKIKHMRLLTLQLGHVIERYVEIERWPQMVKIRYFLIFLPVRSSENDNDHPHLVV